MQRTFHYRNIFEPVGLKLIFDPTCLDPTLEQSSNFASSDLGGTASCNPWQSENDIICVLSFIVFWILDHEWDNLGAGFIELGKVSVRLFGSTNSPNIQYSFAIQKSQRGTGASTLSSTCVVTPSLAQLKDFLRDKLFQDWALWQVVSWSGISEISYSEILFQVSHF